MMLCAAKVLKEWKEGATLYIGVKVLPKSECAAKRVGVRPHTHVYGRTLPLRVCMALFWQYTTWWLIPKLNLGHNQA